MWGLGGGGIDPTTIPTPVSGSWLWWFSCCAEVVVADREVWASVSEQSLLLGETRLRKMAWGRGAEGRVGPCASQ